MSNYIEQLFQEYKQRGFFIDTNILLLWCVGCVNTARISKFKRTKLFSQEDYESLERLFKYFSNKIITTSNILTEVNSLVNQIGEPERSRCLQVLAQGMVELSEVYIESVTVAKIDKFSKFGLTDCGIIYLARDNYLVLTDDLKLAHYLQNIGIDAVKIIFEIMAGNRKT